MADNTSFKRVIVLKKTKLGENDLILRCLTFEGELLEMLAKGARKPTNPFATRLELFSCAEVLLISRKTLPLVKEARTVFSFQTIRDSLEKTTAVAPMTELLALVAQTGLTHEQLFPMTLRALQAAERVDTNAVLTISAAHILKALAMVGFMPNLTFCSVCGAPIGLRNNTQALQSFSFSEGGLLCQSCLAGYEHTRIPVRVIFQLSKLLKSTFDELEDTPLRPADALGVFRFEQQWIAHHVERRLKSLDFLFTSGLWNNTTIVI